MNPKKCVLRAAAVLLSLAVLLPAAPSAFAAQSGTAGTSVVFSESAVTVSDGSGLSIDGTSLTIEQSGTYVLSGTCSDGSVRVKKGVTGVTLVLSGLDLTSSTTASITCGKSSGVTILAAEGTENALTDAAANNGDNYPDNADAENAVIKCKDGSQVTIGGTGTLTVTANGKNGIKSGATTDEEGTAWLVIEDLTLTINAPVNDAVNAEASLTVKSGTITIDAGDDALHADYALAIGESGTAGPTITINSCYEGLAGANLLVASGAITIYSEDDCLNAANSDLTGYDFTMDITGGTIWAYAASDDGLDSNGSLTISGSTLTVWTANTADNQALDADGTITVSGGTVFAAGGSAGMGMTLSASQPYVTFGTQASQPGQGGRQQNGGNAPGGQQDGSTPPSMPDGQSGSQPQQPGGAQTAGTQQVPPEKPQDSTDGSSAPEPPTGGGQPGQDAQGGQGGMAQPGGVSSLGIQSGSAVTVQDADGNTLFDGEAPCAVSTVFFSSPDLTDGETATLTSDGEGVATATASTDGSGTSQTITPAAQTAAAASSQKWLTLGLVTAAGVAAVVGAAIAVKKSKKKD